MYQERDLVSILLSSPKIAQLDEAIQQAREKLKSKLSHLPPTNLEKHKNTIADAQDAMDKLDRKVEQLETQLVPLLLLYKEQKQEEQFATGDLSDHPDRVERIRSIDSTSEISPSEEKEKEDEYSEMKTQYLAKAREIAVQDIYIEYEVASDVCTVSKSALSLVDLCMQILSEAEFDENATRQLQLYNTVKKIIDLYMIIVPVKYEVNLRSDPRAASLLHDSLLFIAQFVMSSPQINESPVDFADVIQRLLESADAANHLSQIELTKVLTKKSPPQRVATIVLINDQLELWREISDVGLNRQFTLNCSTLSDCHRKQSHRGQHLTDERSVQRRRAKRESAMCQHQLNRPQ